MAAIRRYVSQNLVTGLRVSPRSAPRSLWLFIGAYVVFAVTMGLGSGLLTPSSPTWFELLILPPMLLIYPSLIEESLFRGLLLPRSLMQATTARRFVAVTIATALFVLMHVVNAVFIGLSDTSQFLEPAFLAIVAALGYTCSYLYLRSGSLWAPILLHWATVVAWNLFFGRDLSL